MEETLKVRNFLKLLDFHSAHKGGVDIFTEAYLWAIVEGPVMDGAVLEGRILAYHVSGPTILFEIPFQRKSPMEGYREIKDAGGGRVPRVKEHLRVPLDYPIRIIDPTSIWFQIDSVSEDIYGRLLFPNEEVIENVIRFAGDHSLFYDTLVYQRPEDITETPSRKIPEISREELARSLAAKLIRGLPRRADMTEISDSETPEQDKEEEEPEEDLLAECS